MINLYHLQIQQKTVRLASGCEQRSTVAVSRVIHAPALCALCSDVLFIKTDKPSLIRSSERQAHMMLALFNIRMILVNKA